MPNSTWCPWNYYRSSGDIVASYASVVGNLQTSERHHPRRCVLAPSCGWGLRHTAALHAAPDSSEHSVVNLTSLYPVAQRTAAIQWAKAGLSSPGW